MKQVFLKDLRGILASRVMIVASFVILEIFVMIGAFSNNVGLTSTALYVYIFATIGIILYHVMEAGSIYLGNLRQVPYFDKMKSDGIPASKVLLFKHLHTWISMMICAVLYVGGLALDVLLVLKRFPGEKEGLEGFGLHEMIVGAGDAFVPALITTVLEYAMIMLVMLALGYFAVTMTFAFFVKQRFTGFFSVVVYITFGYSIVAINRALAGAFQGIALHLMSSLANVVLAAILFFVTLWGLRSKILAKRQDEML